MVHDHSNICTFGADGYLNTTPSMTHLISLPFTFTNRPHRGAHLGGEWGTVGPPHPPQAPSPSQRALLRATQQEPQEAQAELLAAIPAPAAGQGHRVSGACVYRHQGGWHLELFSTFCLKLKSDATHVEGSKVTLKKKKKSRKSQFGFQNNSFVLYCMKQVFDHQPTSRNFGSLKALLASTPHLCQESELATKL